MMTGDACLDARPDEVVSRRKDRDMSDLGAFEGRVVSALTGKGLPGAQLTFAQDDATSSVIAAADGEIGRAHV